MKALFVQLTVLAKQRQWGYNANMSRIPNLEACERVGTTPAAQPEQMVCGRFITQNPPYPNTATHHGKLIVFCTRYCLEAFLADPERFFAAHSRNNT